MPIFLTLLYGLLAISGTSLHLVHFGAAEVIMKTLPALFLTGVAWAYTRPRFSIWVTIGVAFGAMGDYSLSNAARSWFLAGVFAFLLGHLAYSAAFAKDLKRTGIRTSVICITFLAMAVLLVLVAIRMVNSGEQGLIFPVTAYVIVMGIMMAICVCHDSSTRFIAVGSVVFILSDAHIAINHMLLDAPWTMISISGYVTYYLAQYLIVAGAVRETRSWMHRP